MLLAFLRVHFFRLPAVNPATRILISPLLWRLTTVTCRSVSSTLQPIIASPGNADQRLSRSGTCHELVRTFWTGTGPVEFDRPIRDTFGCTEELSSHS